MSDIGVNDILISARQEAYRMRHFYVGVEHLFIALLEIRGSLTGDIAQSLGLTPEYIIDSIRRKMGKGGKARLWAGVPNTPRADAVLARAEARGLEHDGDVSERDVLIELLSEERSIPLRVLAELGQPDAVSLREKARNHTLKDESRQPFVNVTYGEGFNSDIELSRQQEFILRRMFYGYAQVRIDRHLPGGFSDALLIVVTPMHADRREDAPVVVKINAVDNILDEAQRYESHVKSKLPPMTARIEDRPVAPDSSDLAGVKYTLISDHDRIPRDLRTVFGTWDIQQIQAWIRDNLFPTFAHIWWLQNRPYRFQVWREYDWLLPPILTLDHMEGQQPPSKAFRMRMPVKRAKLRRLDFGDAVIVENFVVQRVYQERNAIQLAVSHGTEAARAYKIEVRGIDFDKMTFYRGEVIESLAGTIWNTRGQQLFNAARSLSPDFDLEAEKIHISDDLIIPNPLLAYEGLLDSYVNGTLSTIHGDLHPGNIMIGPNNSAFLIDFAHARDGHTVFDWVAFESSITADYLIEDPDASWDEVRSFAHWLHDINGILNETSDIDVPDNIFQVIVAIREIAKQCLSSPENWAEYFVALVFCSLRALTWETISISGRRLALLTAGLAIYELRTRFRPISSTDTPSPDDTEINTPS